MIRALLLIATLAVSTGSLADDPTREGMGTAILQQGVRFRVWAPNAKAMYVSGDFNHWEQTSIPMEREAHDNFMVEVPEAKVGQKYRFWIETPEGEMLARNDPRARQVENSAGLSIIHDPASYRWKTGAYQTPYFNSTVIYELHLGTFEAVRGGAPGTWRSAMTRLDYLKDLGINLIEVMPPSEFPGDFSWGYNPSYIFAPESAYGTPDDMKAFIDAAHARGIGVVMDVVHSHHGPTDLPNWCFDGPCYGHGGIYYYTDYRADTPWGSTRPDYGRVEVRNFIKDSVLMWLNEYRLDGLRFDGTKFMRTTDGSNGLADGWNLLRSISDEVKAKQPWKILIAEDFGAGDAMTRGTYWGGAGFDAQWSGEFMHPVRDALIAPTDEGRNMGSIAWSINQRFNGIAMQRVVYTESHDESANGQERLPEAIWPGNSGSRESQKRSTLGAVLTLTSPGIPMLFQGQEILENGWFDDKDPVDWQKSKSYSGITDLYRDLIRMRRNYANNTRGLQGENVNVFHVNDKNKVIAYHRWDKGGPGDDVVVVVNFSNQWFPSYQVGFPRGGYWYARFNSDSKVYSAKFGGTQTFDTVAYPGGKDGLGFNASFALGPYSAVIFSQ